MDYISQTKTLFVGTNSKSILTINIEKLLDPMINLLSFNKEEFDLTTEMEAMGFQPGININDVLNNQGEVSNIEDMSKIERLLDELRQKEEQDRNIEDNNSEYLEAQEGKNDEDLRMLLQEQERILQQDQQN